MLRSNLNQQKGIVLLMLVIIITLAFITYAVTSLSINDIKYKNAENTQLALKKAKSALLNFAITHMNQVGDAGEMGFLPCPDTAITVFSDEGVQESPCGSQYENSIGFLPWATLDLPVLKDSSGSCLLYAVSNTYKLNPTNMLNDDSNGMLQVVNSAGVVQGSALPEDRYVAIVFSPGEPLAGQVRTFDAETNCGNDYNVTAFLEGVGLINNGVLSTVDNTIDQFIHKASTSAVAQPLYNDKFITISKSEIWSAITAKNNFITTMSDLTMELAVCLARHSKLGSNRRLPWPVQLDVNSQNYREDASYDDNVGIYAGRYPFRVVDSSAASDITEGTDILFEYSGLGQCDNITTEYRKLWENWKDHFFYALSKDYEPGSTGETVCASNCIKVDSNEYAGAVIFSGLKYDNTIERNDIFSGDPGDDKADVFNYLENGYGAIFLGADGSDSYNKVDTLMSNDIMFCITDELTTTDLNVVPCS